MKNRNNPEHIPVNKPVLLIMDDWISSGIPLATGQVPRMMCAQRHNNISSILLL